MALEMFEKCQTHHYDVPRMLFEDTVALQNYCTSSEDPYVLHFLFDIVDNILNDN